MPFLPPNQQRQMHTCRPEPPQVHQREKGQDLWGGNYCSMEYWTPLSRLKQQVTGFKKYRLISNCGKMWTQNNWTDLGDCNPLDERQSKTSQSSETPGTGLHEAECGNESDPVEQKRDWNEWTQTKSKQQNMGHTTHQITWGHLDWAAIRILYCVYWSEAIHHHHHKNL